MEQEAIKLNLSWRPQNVRFVRSMRYLPRQAANREWNQPTRMKFVSAERQICKQRMKGVGDLKASLTLDMEMFDQLAFGLALVQYFFTVTFWNDSIYPVL